MKKKLKISLMKIISAYLHIENSLSASLKILVRLEKLLLLGGALFGDTARLSKCSVQHDSTNVTLTSFFFLA